MIEVRGLKKSFKDVDALKGVDLRVEEGEVLGLLGENGAGKLVVISLGFTRYMFSKESVIFRS